MKYKFRNWSAAEIEKLNGEKKARNKRKEGTFKPFSKKSCFVNKTTQTSHETSNTYN